MKHEYSSPLGEVGKHFSNDACDITSDVDIIALDLTTY